MIRLSFEGYTFRAAGLFASARHDWMRFHAGDVKCPDIACYGILLWKDSSRKELKCDHCNAEFVVKKRVKLNV